MDFPLFIRVLDVDVAVGAATEEVEITTKWFNCPDFHQALNQFLGCHEPSVWKGIEAQMNSRNPDGNSLLMCTILNKERDNR